MVVGTSRARDAAEANAERRGSLIIHPAKACRANTCERGGRGRAHLCDETTPPTCGRDGLAPRPALPLVVSRPRPDNTASEMLSPLSKKHAATHFSDLRPQTVPTVRGAYRPYRQKRQRGDGG